MYDPVTGIDGCVGQTSGQTIAAVDIISGIGNAFAEQTSGGTPVIATASGGDTDIAAWRESLRQCTFDEVDVFRTGQILQAERLLEMTTLKRHRFETGIGEVGVIDALGTAVRKVIFELVIPYLPQRALHEQPGATDLAAITEIGDITVMGGCINQQPAADPKLEILVGGSDFKLALGVDFRLIAFGCGNFFFYQLTRLSIGCC